MTINIKDVIVLQTYKTLHTFTLLLSGQIAIAKPTLRNEKLPPLRIIQKNIQQQWKKCQKRYQYILNNEGVIRIRKYFEGKSFHLNEWKKKSIPLLCSYPVPGGMGEEGTSQWSYNTVSRNSKTQGGLSTLQSFSHITWFLILPFIIRRGATLGVVLFLIWHNWYKYLLQLGFSAWWWEWPQRQGWGHECCRGPRNEADHPVEEMRQDRKSTYSIREVVLGQGETLTSIDGFQEDAMEKTGSVGLWKPGNTGNVLERQKGQGRRPCKLRKQGKLLVN